MKKNIIKLYILEILFTIILFIALLVSNKINYIFLASIIFTFSLIFSLTFKRKKTLSIYKKQVILLMTGFAVIYLGIFYLMGLFIYDFNASPILFSFKTIYRYVIPLTVIIISTETIRFTILSQHTKIRILKTKVDLSKILTFINMILIDLIIYAGVYDITNLNEFITVIGFILFASISNNLLYDYITIRYGKAGIIIYRMITILYVYIIPIIPNMYIYFRTFLRMLYPYLIYLVLEHTYSKTDFVISHNDKRKNAIYITGLIIIMSAITMLISCQFKYGILVIGSESMTGTLNIGDAVIYQEYNNNALHQNTIIVFKKNNIKLIHRIIDIKKINGQIRYYTKGDANEKMDTGYVTNDDIIGIVNLKIPYIGYPSIWLREMFA